MAATLALSAESFVGRAEMVTGSYEISTGAYVETLHGARTVPTAEGARSTNPRLRKGVKVISLIASSSWLARASASPPRLGLRWNLTSDCV